MPRPTTTHNAGGAPVDVVGAAGTRQPVEMLATSADCAGDDEFVKAVLFRAGARGCTFHEETREPSLWPTLTDGEAGTPRLSRFTVILPDRRLVSSARYEPRREALSRICGALVRYLDQLDAWDAQCGNAVPLLKS